METTVEGDIRVLAPAEGMRLTDGETVAEGAVYLGKGADPSVWREIAETEAEKIIGENPLPGGQDLV